MTIATDHDLDVQTLVRTELEWTPDVDAAGIGIAVEDGAVTLSGEVDNYAEQLAAKRAALRVVGVRAVVDDMRVHPKSAWPVTETDIAKEVERALRAAANVPAKVKAEVNGHNVTLVGEADWNFQREAAKRAVQYLRGVYTVSNLISLASRPSAEDTEERVRNAIVRNAQLDAKTIDVAVNGTKITLTGTVKSWAEKTQASNAAWSSPSVTDVLNNIIVEPF
jgi:osmotically-inducible protein OsmY